MGVVRPITHRLHHAFIYICIPTSMYIRTYIHTYQTSCAILNDSNPDPDLKLT